MAKREKLQERRTTRSFTQESLATLLHVSPRTVRGWEAGTSAPYPEHRQPLADALHIGLDDLDRLLAGLPIMDANSTIFDATLPTDSTELSRWLADRTISATEMDFCRLQLVNIASDFVCHPPSLWFTSLQTLWRRLHHRLTTGVRPRQVHDVYLLAGMTATVLAHAHHLLGKSREALEHADIALLLADEIDHADLSSWVLGTRALIFDSKGRPIEALASLDQARALSSRSVTSGTGTVRLWTYYARVHTGRGDASAALRAAESAAAADEHINSGSLSGDLDGIGGILTFGTAKRLALTAGAHLASGRADVAVAHTRAAITAYEQGPGQQRSYGDEALAYLDLARGQLVLGDLDGATSSTRVVLTLPPDRRISPLHPSLQDLARSLTAVPRREPAALALRHELDDFRLGNSGTIVV
ncbi:helix-turn-helix domain-containing protein [Saccharothrix sp. Mg75]|uniref:helix-turn-helix domain-containing protein n=1 Tax=Saccharothrix sp. Mg75 TaxID=3445357 RepID=UPI003EEAC1B8